MGATLTVGLSRLVEEASKSGQGLTGQVLDKIVGEMSEAFQVKLDEVAVLHLTHNGAVLSFLYPLKLQKVGSVPMTSTSSLAVRTVREKRPELINNFPGPKTPHDFRGYHAERRNQGQSHSEDNERAPGVGGQGGGGDSGLPQGQDRADSRARFHHQRPHHHDFRRRRAGQGLQRRQIV